ncbi:hypothetical protein ACE3MZ_02925 [Paenibacillus sp. WLX1005]|uniref:hypothetical protein n=1 Tax=Paenibacillus sp. WLX1005 TaxID=3243766 RepID=UPI003983F063
MTPLILVLCCAGLLVLFALAIIVLPALQRRGNLTERIVQEGYAARGLILDLTPTGNYRSGQPELAIHMRIEKPTQLPFEATAVVTVYSIHRSRFQEGIHVPVRVLEDRKGRHVVVKGTVEYP